MSVIVGLVEEGRVYMGADSFIGHGNRAGTIKNVKIFPLSEDILVGCVGSVRPFQLLRYGFALPGRTKGQSAEEYIHDALLKAFRQALQDGGAMNTRGGSISFDACLLLGYDGKLYNISEDLACVVHDDNYDAIGAGEEFALGALGALADFDLPPEEKLKIALKQATKFNPYVRPPFTILSL